MKSHEAWERSISFIEHNLLPEMVQDRVFCEPNSREFVEFDSATVRLDELSRSSEIYRATLLVKFSGEPRTFPLLIKLLPEEGAQNRGPKAFDAFQNEEMFYTKMTAKFGTDLVPKCYLCDLGRYGRAVCVLEDLGEDGYKQVDGELNEDHLKLCVQVLAKFHARGFKLKETEPRLFREFEAKLLEICLTEDSLQRYEGKSNRMIDILDSLTNTDLANKIKSRFKEKSMEIVKRIATENGKPIDVKIIDWQTMRYCSPAVDLGPILLYNVRHQNVRDNEQKNGPARVHEILNLYIDTVRSEYPKVDEQRLREDIEAKFLFACVVLSLLEHITDDEVIDVLSLLGELI
ncbi:unnamed protein product [Xylocopa violacea]|uniref:CHK kinase-like domain-containing protein n=1 Tax=Xylocopa violacea TaxID=135666 RepID=A0ABP1NXU8_XYLVO